MSDWEDEPKTGRSFGDEPAKSQKEVSGWSDDEDTNEKSGGGGDRGGYRRGGENSGGFRRRQDDENVTNVPPIPSSCNKDVVADFIDRLEICQQTTHYTPLYEVRNQRDYLFTAFKDLVSSEWVRLEGLDRVIVRKAQKVRETAATIDRIIMDVNELLGETQVGSAQEQNAIVQLQEKGVNWEENAPNLDTQEIVLPQTTSESSQSRRTRKHNRTKDTHKREPIIDIYEEARRLNEDQQSGDPASGAQENYTEVAVSQSPQTYGSSKFLQNLNSGLLKSHIMRRQRFGNILEVTSRMPWVVVSVSSVWSGSTAPYKKIHSFPEEPMQPTRNEPPRTGKRAADTTSSTQTSRQIDVVRHHRSQNQTLETPDGAYFSRFDATLEEEAAWPATRDITAVLAVEQASSSTPIKRHSELGFSLTANMNMSMIFGRGSTSTPAGDPPMPPEFPLGSIGDSGTIMMSVDNEETAIVGAVASSASEVRSGRLGGGTPASTPLYSFRPRLPVINEELHLNQPQQLATVNPRRMLEMTISSPPNKETLAEPSAIPLPPDTQRRDWGLIFRPRDQMISYSEGSATPRRPVHRARRRRRARTPATVTNNVETPQERIQGEEQVGATISRSSQEIKSFMANLLQKTSAAVSPSRHKTNDLAPAASTSANNRGVDQMELQELEKNHAPAEPLISKNLTNDESTFQQPRCAFKDPTMDNATLEVLQSSPAPAASQKILETLPEPPRFSDVSNEKITDINTTLDILNISEIATEQPPFPTIEPMEIDNLTANLSEHALVTNVQILSGPIATAVSLCNLPNDTSNISKEVGEQSQFESRRVVLPEIVELEKGRDDGSLYHRESIEALGYIVHHVDMLRLNIDRQKELSLIRESPESPSNFSMPAVKVFDPKIVVNLPQIKIRLVHSMLGALVKQHQVDMRNADFIQNRKDAAVTFRLLLDLKAANIINLSKDGRIFSLK